MTNTNIIIKKILINKLLTSILDILLLILLIILLFCTSSSKLLAQKETYNWYFGDSAGVSFMPNGDSPYALTGSKIRQMEGSATISDKDGNLLFYSDGITVWNKKHNGISGGGGLKGNQSSARSVIIVPKPRSNRYYYVFTIDAYERTTIPAADTNGLRYSIIDALAENGNGAIIDDTRNIQLLNGAVEKMISVNHANKIDLWLITYNRKNNSFYTYLIDKNGIASPTITKISELASIESDETRFNLDYDIKHHKLINCSRINFSFELYDFDIATGKIDVENVLKLPSFNYEEPESEIIYMPYSGVLSPDGTKFYGTCFRQRIVQFDLTTNNINEIINSRVIIADSINGDGAFGAIRRGPDDILYIASDMKDYLATISSPNNLGLACNFVKQGVYLGGAKSRMGLPIMMNYSVPPCNFSGYAGGNKTICLGESLQLGDSLDIINFDITNFEFEWQPATYLDNPRSLNPICTPLKTTQYILKITDKSLECFDFDTITVSVKPVPVIQKSADRTTCKNGTVIIGNENNSDEYEYSWFPATYLSTPNSKTTYCQPEKDMTYFLSVTNSAGCVIYDTIHVVLEQLGDISITGDKFICDGDSTILRITGNFLACKWNTGETTDTIVVKIAGIYSAEVVDNKGCVGDIFFTVDLFDDAAVKIIAPVAICSGGTATLQLADKYDTYLWSNGETTETIEIFSSGKYWVKVTNSTGCQASDTIEIPEKIINFTVPNSLDFGVTCINVTANRIFMLDNLDEDEIIISNLKLAKNSSEFYIVQVNLPIVLSASASQEFSLEFTSNSTGIFTDTLIIEISEPCTATIKILLTANTTSSLLTFSSKDFTAQPGEHIEIPISLRISSDNNSDNNIMGNIEFDYSYNATLLKIDKENISGGNIIEKNTENNVTTLKISMLVTDTLTDNIVKIFAMVLLGDTISSELRVSNPVADFTSLACLQFDNCINTLRLTGCAIDLRSIRFIEPTSLQLQQVLATNNTSNNVISCEVKTEETGNIILELRDISGAIINKIYWHRLEKNKVETKNFIFDANNLSSGVYFVTLVSERNRISRKILLTK